MLRYDRYMAYCCKYTMIYNSLKKLTRGKNIVTDCTNASRTLLMDLGSLEWSQKILELFEIKECWLPKIIKSNAANFGIIDAA